MICKFHPFHAHYACDAPQFCMFTTPRRQSKKAGRARHRVASCLLCCLSVGDGLPAVYLDRNLSTLAAVSFPLAIALTTSDAPLAASPATNTLSANLGCSGRRKPMARSAISHFITSGLPAGSIMGRPPSGLGFHVISCTRTPVSRPSLPMNSSEFTFQRRVQPSS